MNSPSAPGSGRPPPAGDDGATGLPGLRTWPRVYWFVVGSFIVWVVLLTLLTKVFS
jgi:hypothetical protein